MVVRDRCSMDRTGGSLDDRCYLYSYYPLSRYLFRRRDNVRYLFLIGLERVAGVGYNVAESQVRVFANR